MSDLPEGFLFIAAADVSEWMKPPWWRPVKRLRWRRRHQQGDVYLSFVSALRGEQEPIRRYGLSIDYSKVESPTDQMLRQIADLDGDFR